MKKKIGIIFFLILVFVGSGCTNSTLNDSILESNFSQEETDPKWNDIEQFLKQIAMEDIETIPLFYLYGSEVGYERVKSTNYGYLPFYHHSDLEIIDEIVPMSNLHIRPGKERSQTKYIVIHNTGMASPTMTAKRLSQSINNSTRQASWHFTIDDKEVYQQLGIEEIGWHASTTEGNNYGIGIEMAVYQGIDFNQAMRNTAKLTAQLLILYDLTIDNVKQHYDFNGKNCPQVLREANRWQEFLKLIEIEFYAQKYLSDVEFVWTSLSPDIIDDEGRIVSRLGLPREVKYQVEVKFQEQVRTYFFKSKLQDLK